MEYAGFWRRVGAFVIDYIIVVVAVSIIAMVLGCSSRKWWQLAIGGHAMALLRLFREL